MVNLREYVLVLEAREPLSYGEETIGIKMLAKRINLYLPERGTIIAIPAVLGNALRGVLRDVMAEAFIEEVLKHVKKPEWHAGALLTLFSGGMLRGEQRVERVTAAAVAERVAQVVRLLTPLSIMGCALPGIMVPSKVKLATFYPACEETRTLIDDLVERVEDEKLKGALKKSLEQSVENFIIDVQMMRKDDTMKVLQLTRARGIKVTGLEEAVPEGEEAKKAKASEERPPAVQMLFYRQALAPGTLLIGKLTELMPLSQEELGLLFLSLERLSAVGGAIARGFGEVVIRNLPEAPEGTVEAFRNFVGEHAEEISDYLAKSPEKWLVRPKK